MQKNRFESLGLYLPENVVTSTELMESINGHAHFDLEKLTGIKTRHVRAKNEDSYALGLKAARDCLANSRYAAEDLDVIIYISIMRTRNGMKQQLDPAISLFIKRELGASRAMNFDMTNACAGMGTGTYVLNSMLAAGTVKNGLVISGECITPIADTAIHVVTKPTHEQMSALTVGDSGSAFIMDALGNENEGIEILDLVTVGQYAELCIGMPSDTMAGISMYTKSSFLHTQAVKRMTIYVDRCLKKFNKSIRDFDFFVPHQTATYAITSGIDIMNKFYEEEGGMRGETVSIVAEFGNTSSTSHFVALYKYLQDKRIKKGDTILFIILASGIVLGCISFKVGNIGVSNGHNN